MRSLFHVTGLAVLLLLVGCAAKTERVGFDAEKASVANAELGVAYLKQGKYKVAMTKLKKAIAYDEDNTNANHYIAILYGRLEQNDLADKHFKTAIRLDEEDSAIKNNYGIFLCGMGSYEKGLKLFQDALLDPLYRDKGQAYENMGLCAEKQGNILKAENSFEEALKHNPNLPAALLGLAQNAFDRQNIKKASFYLARHNKIVKNKTAQSLWLDILIARKTGNKGKAGSLAIKLRNAFPDSKEAGFLKKLKIR